MTNAMDYPVTPAVRWLREKRVEFTPHLYEYEERGGTRRSSAALGVSEHAVIKTLVMETEGRKPLIVLMHGDREVSTKNLARHLGVKSVKPCDPASAQRHTGYVVGGTSPFGTRSTLPVYVERSIFDLSSIYINGGKRGFLVRVEPEVLRMLSPLEEVEVGIEKGEA